MEGWYSKPRSGWHVTDIALCPRQRVFKAIDPLPLTDKELNMYSSGESCPRSGSMAIYEQSAEVREGTIRRV